MVTFRHKHHMYTPDSWPYIIIMYSLEFLWDHATISGDGIRLLIQYIDFQFNLSFMLHTVLWFFLRIDVQHFKRNVFSEDAHFHSDVMWICYTPNMAYIILRKHCSGIKEHFFLFTEKEKSPTTTKNNCFWVHLFGTWFSLGRFQDCFFFFSFPNLIQIDLAPRLMRVTQLEMRCEMERKYQLQRLNQKGLLAKTQSCQVLSLIQQLMLITRLRFLASMKHLLNAICCF